MHIVQVAAFPFPTPQGSQVYVRGMARALARRGHRVTVVCYGHGLGDPDPEYEVVRTPRIAGYKRVRSGPDAVKPVLDVALAVRLCGLRPDVIHAHNYEGSVAALASRPWHRAPIIYSAHNTMGEELHTYFRGRVARAAARRMGRLLDATIPRACDHALAISESAVPVLRRLGCRHVSLALPGVDPEDLAPVEPARLPPGPWVVYAGNPDRYQDLDDLAEAMRRVPEFGLLLVSASPLDDWRDRGLPRLRIEVTRDWARVRSLLAAATIAALPRTVCTGFPIKLLNYLGMGLPVVAARGSARGIPGVVAVPDHDPNAMAGALAELLADPARCRRLGAEGRRAVLGQWTWQQRAAELEEVYREVLDRLGRTSS